MATSAAAAVASAVARARRQVLEHFENGDAFVPERAIQYEPPDHMHRRQFEVLIGRGIVKEAADGRFWVDRQAIEREAQLGRRALKWVLLVIAAGGVLGVALAFAVMR